jgi:hypothetical protein
VSVPQTKSIGKRAGEHVAASPHIKV